MYGKQRILHQLDVKERIMWSAAEYVANGKPS